MSGKPNSTLGKDWIFISIMILGCCICIGVSAFLCIGNKLYFCSEKDCFAYFLTLFEFPLKTAACTLTLAGFRIIIFRSNQTQMQIDEMMAQNTFSNYLAHKKEFIAILEDFEKQEKICIRFPEKVQLYKELFPENSPIHSIFHSEVLESIIVDYNKIIAELKHEKETPSCSDITDHCVEIIFRLHDLMKKLQIEVDSNVKMLEPEYQRNGVSEWLPVNFDSAVRDFSKSIELMKNFCIVENLKNISIDKLEFSLSLDSIMDSICNYRSEMGLKDSPF